MCRIVKTTGKGDFTDAQFHSALYMSTESGFTAEQLYSTATYQDGNLIRLGMGGNDLSGWDFASKNLADADFPPRFSLN